VRRSASLSSSFVNDSVKPNVFAFKPLRLALDSEIMQHVLHLPWCDSWDALRVQSQAQEGKYVSVRIDRLAWQQGPAKHVTCRATAAAWHSKRVGS